MWPAGEARNFSIEFMVYLLLGFIFVMFIIIHWVILSVAKSPNRKNFQILPVQFYDHSPGYLDHPLHGIITSSVSFSAITTAGKIFWLGMAVAARSNYCYDPSENSL